MAEQVPRVVTVHKRLRPIRLAFLVRPTDKASVRRVIQINTSLWGGLYNPIIVIHRKRPAWAQSESARVLVNGHIDAFEPDFLPRLGAPSVEVDPGYPRFARPAAPAGTPAALRGRARCGRWTQGPPAGAPDTGCS